MAKSYGYGTEYTRLVQPASYYISFENKELHNYWVSLGMAGERKFQRIHVEYERAEMLYVECHIGHNSKNNSTS